MNDVVGKKQKSKEKCIVYIETKTLRFVAHERPWSEDREKKKSIKLFLFYIFLDNTWYWSVSLYYKYNEMSAKHNYIFSCFSSVNQACTPHRMESSARAEPRKSARAALCSTQRRFINNRPIRAKLREKLPHCLRNKKP